MILEQIRRDEQDDGAAADGDPQSVAIAPQWRHVIPDGQHGDEVALARRSDGAVGLGVPADVPSLLRAFRVRQRRGPKRRALDPFRARPAGLRDSREHGVDDWSGEVGGQLCLGWARRGRLPGARGKREEQRRDPPEHARSLLHVGAVSISSG